MEEASDEHYLKDHYNADLDSVTIIKFWGVPNYGDPAEWQAFYRWIRTADLTQPEDSAYAYERMDVPGFIDYILFETFSANLDWPGNNVKISQMAPGKPFRMMFYDGDGCFSRVEYQALGHALHDEITNRVLSHYMENQYFRFRFCERYGELKQTYFSYDFMKSILDEYRTLVEGEVEAQHNRFHFPWSVNRFYVDMEQADDFLRRRDEYFMEELGPYLDVEEIIPAAAFCYPNPFTDEIHISWEAEHDGSEEIAIFDVMGRRVFVQLCRLVEGENHVVITPQLPPGLYLVKFGPYLQRMVRD